MVWSPLTCHSISSSTSRACTGRAQSAQIAAARPSRHAGPPGFWPALQHLATHYPPHSNAPSHPGSLQRHRQSFWRHTGGRSAPLPRSAPSKPPGLATCPKEQRKLILRSSASSRRRHDAVTLQGGGSPSSLSPAAAEPPCLAYIRTPELIRARMQPQSTSLVSPWQPIDLRRSSSSSPATPAAATVPSIPAPPGPLPPISLHQEHLLPSRNPTPYLILIGSHRRHKITLSPKPPPPRSSPPATPSTPGDPATTGRTA